MKSYPFLLFLFSCFNLLNAEEGLFKVKDTRVPGAIEIAGESVLQMVLVGEPAQKIAAASYDTYLRSNPGENFILFLTIEKVKRCKERGLSFCEINFQSYGSAFLTDDGKILWTAKHVIQPQLGSKLSFELYNSDGEKLFDSTDSKDQVELLLAGNGDIIQKRHANEFVIDDNLKQLTSDYAKLKLNRNLAIRALRIASQKPQINQRVFTVGYANVTGYRAPTSNGGVKTRSRVAIGMVTPYSEARPNETPQQKQNRDALDSFASQHLIIMDLDGLPGQSGSPVLNESGEVVGIFIAGNSTISGRGALKGIAPHFEGILKNGH
ncbi:MAG: trypsin-like peptidase domain-containing protein [Bdellovibrionota bacterium]